MDVIASKQDGVKFYWKKDQNMDTYPYYRVDANLDDKRSANDISQQEMKNVVCFILSNSSNLTKEVLIKETVRAMGYKRSGAALVDAIERGIKYGCKTGEILVNESSEYKLGRYKASEEG